MTDTFQYVLLSLAAIVASFLAIAALYEIKNDPGKGHMVIVVLLVLILWRVW